MPLFGGGRVREDGEYGKEGRERMGREDEVVGRQSGEMRAVGFEG